MDPSDEGPGFVVLRAESSRDGSTHLTHALPHSSLTTAWTLWVPEGSCPLALKEFSTGQLHVSTHFLVLIPLPQEVT